MKIQLLIQVWRLMTLRSYCKQVRLTYKMCIDLVMSFAHIIVFIIYRSKEMGNRRKHVQYDIGYSKLRSVAVNVSSVRES